MESSKPDSHLYLSDKRSLYIGKPNGVVQLSKASALFIVSLGQELSLLDAAGAVLHKCNSILVPVGTQVIIDTGHSLVACCFLDYLGADVSSLTPLMKNQIAIAKSSRVFTSHLNEVTMLNMFRAIHSGTPSARIVFDQLDVWIGLPSIFHQGSVDGRIAQSIDYIRRNTLNDPGVDEIAAAVNLSVSRFSQLFKKQTGINYRRLKVWSRIYLTACLIAHGESLTDAAIIAGFSDYAHFSRSFTEMSGLSPSKILSARTNIHMATLASVDKFENMRMERA